MQTRNPEWKVEFSVYGPITLKDRNRSFRTSQQKGLRSNDPFYSDIEISARTSRGVEVCLTAKAPKQELAKRAGLVFFGQMLDALTLDINLPVYLNLFESAPIQHEKHSERRIITEEEWVEAFKESRLLSENQPIFLRALGWYRKGLVSDDPLDQYFSFWNSIEIIANNYHTKTEKTKNGIKNQIYQHFEDIWKDKTNWPMTQEEISLYHSIRNQIAHGVIPINTKKVYEIVEFIERIKTISHTYLIATRKNIHISITKPKELSSNEGWVEIE